MADENSKFKVQNSKLNNTSDTSSKPTSGAKTMADLMASAKPTMVALQKGDTVEGVITKVSSAEILININAKSLALIIEKDRRMMRSLLSTLKVGDKVKATVLSSESDMGYPILSLRRFMEERVWDTLADKQKEGKQVPVAVTASTRGGYLVSMPEGASGFLPNSQVVSTENAQDLTGKTINCYIIELNRGTKKIVFSQKKTMNPEEFQQAISGLKEKDKVKVTVTTVTPFGIFVVVKAPSGKDVDGLVHISEVAWEKVETVDDLYTVGQVVEAAIIGFDTDAKRVDLSVRRLSEDPFQAVFKKFTVDQKVSGTVTRITSSGVSVDLSGVAESSVKVEGFIKKEKIPPTVKYEEGAKVQATVSEIDSKRHRILLVPVLKEKPIGYR